MRLENILALTNAKLLNKPFVTTFTNISFHAKDVKRGDLFIAFDEENIEEAIFNGAYGILFSKPTQISDTEIAWMKVDNIDTALKRLLRFQLLKKDLIVYEVNEIILKLALQVITESKFFVVHGDIVDIAKSLWEIDKGSIILFCPSLREGDIFTKTIELSQTTYNDINIVEQTLFETSFIYDNIFYERQLISPFFMPYLEVLLNLFKNKNINYRLKKFVPIDHFEAVFTNKRFEIKDFGTSDKVLIFEKNSSLVDAEIGFLHKEATWAKIIYVLPYSEQKLIDSVVNKESLLVYKNKNEILGLLKEVNFNFALLIGIDKDILTKPLSSQAEISLFDFSESHE